MCQIWIKASGVTLPRVFWDAINSSNREGLGLYNIDKDEIFKTEDYEAAWEYINAHKQDKMVVHHRLATSGAKTLDQLHGWDMGNGYVFFHNGVLRTYSGTKTTSDTQEMVEEWHGAPIKAFVRYLESMERSSRFVLIHRETGEIIRPDCATWNPIVISELGNKEVLFSNDYAFNYSLLPPQYSRWSGYDNAWKRNGHGAAETISGSKASFSPKSVFEHKECYEVIEGKAADWVYNSTRHTYVNAALGMESFIKPIEDSYIEGVMMPDIVRLTKTGEYVMHHAVLSSAASGEPLEVLPRNHVDSVTMNALLSCGSQEVAMAYIRMARKHQMNKDLTEWHNKDLLTYIRSYELRVGNRVDIDFMLYEFLHILMTFNSASVIKGDEMRMAAIFSNAVAQEIGKPYEYFKSLVKRVHNAVQAELDAQVKKTYPSVRGGITQAMIETYRNQRTLW